MTGAGVSDAAAARDADFSAYMAARTQALVRTAYLLSGDLHTAEDLVQTALAKLDLAWDRIESRNALDSYVLRVIVNEHNSLWRRPWKRREAVTETLPETGEDDQYDDGTNARLWSFVQTLPRRQRAVIVLRFYEGLSDSEIAETLQISTGTVKSQASRALAALRDRAPASLISTTEPTSSRRES